MASSLALGFGVGLVIAASPGPIFFLVVRRTLDRGLRSGLASGAGVASADGFYALIAAAGVAAVASLLAAERRWLTAGGGLILLAIGLRGLLSRPAPATAAPGSPVRLAGDYLSTLGLTLANPSTVLAFAAVMAGLGSGLVARGLAGPALVLGVLLGSAAWWLVLSGTVTLFRERVGTGAARGLALVSGAAIFAFGLAALAEALH